MIYYQGKCIILQNNNNNPPHLWKVDLDNNKGWVYNSITNEWQETGGNVGVIIDLLLSDLDGICMRLKKRICYWS